MGADVLSPQPFFYRIVKVDRPYAKKISIRKSKTSVWLPSVCIYIYIHHWYSINISHYMYVYIYISGWWFGTVFIFPYIGNNNPNWLPYFSEGLKPSTRHIYIYIYTHIYIYTYDARSKHVIRWCLCLDRPSVPEGLPERCKSWWGAIAAIATLHKGPSSDSGGRSGTSLLGYPGVN